MGDDDEPAHRELELEMLRSMYDEELTTDVYDEFSFVLRVEIDGADGANGEHAELSCKLPAGYPADTGAAAIAVLTFLSQRAVESVVQRLTTVWENVCRVLPHNSPDLRGSSGNTSPSLSSNAVNYA